MNALVFGSDIITVGSLKHLIKCSAIKKLEVVTPFTNKKSAPISFCNLNNINYHYLPSNIDFKLTNYNIPTTYKWDIAILISFGYFIPKNIISLFPNGIINVHPSLLPQYIGCSPIPYSLLNGDKITGISIIDITQIIDNGNILKQDFIKIDNINDSYYTLSHKLADFGGKLLCQTLLNLKKYRENSIKQNENIENIKLLYNKYDDIDKFKLIKTKKINKNMSYIDWRLSIKQIFNQHRAINGLLKNSKTILGTKYNDKKLLILIDKFIIIKLNKNIFNKNDKIGTIKYCKYNDILFVKCGDDDDNKQNNKNNNNEFLGIKQLRIAPSMSSQHLANFDNFINEFGHFVTHFDSNQYKQYMKFMKNHF